MQEKLDLLRKEKTEEEEKVATGLMSISSLEVRMIN